MCEMDKKIVKEVALANGFKLKEQPDGSLELNPYVYVFADKLVEHQLAKVCSLEEQVEELQQDLEAQREETIKGYTKISDLRLERDELQKRVQFLEQELGAWKGKSIAAMINGMCKQCGKEPWQAIVSDKDGYALLQCFGCGANKYELVGEQALKGEGQ